MAHLKRKILSFCALMVYTCLGNTKIYKNLSKKYLSNVQKSYMEKLILKNSLYKNCYKKIEKKTPCTIYFDISNYMFSEAVSGIQRVVSMFLKYLPDVLKEGKYCVKCVADVKGYRQVEFIDGKWKATYNISPAEKDLFLCMDLTSHEILNNKKQIVSFKKSGCKLAFCVYDLVFEKYPEFVRFENSCKVLSEWMSFILSVSDVIIADSQTVMKEIKDWVKGRKKVNPDLKYCYFHLGSDFKRRNMKKAHSAFTFIAVSTIEPRKGYMELIRAYEKSAVSKENSRLIIVGREGWKCQDVVKEIESSSLYCKKLFWYRNASDKELENLYTESNVYVSSSYYEGFGLGLVEASAYGLPLLVRDIPVYREIVQDSGMYFTDTETLVRSMEACYNSKYIENKIKYLNWRESVKMAFEAVQEMGLLC